MNFRKGVFRFLDETEELRHDDLCRPLGEFPSMVEKQYSDFEWRLVSDYLPYWVGKTLLDLNNALYDNAPYEQEFEAMRKIA